MKIKLMLSIMILVCLFTVPACAQIGYTNISNISIYENADYASKVTKVIKISTPLKILEESNGWYNVKAGDGTRGWIEKYFLSVPPDKYAVNNTSYDVNIRTGPSASSEAAGQLKPGEKAVYIDTYHSWHIIEYNGKQYYIASWLTDITSYGTGNIFLMYDSINIRNLPGFSGKVISQGNTNDSYPYYGEKNGWFKIKLPDNSFGYVAGWLTSFDKNHYFYGTNAYKTNISDLNLRTGPSAEYKLIKSIPAMSKLRIISSKDGWDKVLDDSGSIGWCNSSYLKNCLPLSGKKILLDPGHGGKDTGSIGYSGKYEKNINLTVANKTKAVLENMGAIVYMTRNNDTYIANKNRGNMADRLGCDLLLVIHHNSIDASRSVYHGLSTYYNTINYKDKSYGYTLAEEIYLNAVTVNGVYCDGVLDRNFEVLRETNTPAALIEIGFMSNPKEEGNIHNESFQNIMAQKLANGVIDYFRAVQ